MRYNVGSAIHLRAKYDPFPPVFSNSGHNTVYYSFRAFRCTVPASLDAHRYLFYFRKKNRYQSTTNKQKMLVKQNKKKDTRKT